MPQTDISRYQAEMAQMLRRIYRGVSVKTEWPTAFGAAQYSPRVDIAVGPFAIQPGVRYINEYDNLMISSRGFIEKVIAYHLHNVEEAGPVSVSTLFERIRGKNRNARCFIAIEIENQVSRKHLMGSAVNAAALGRIGLAVAWTPEKLRAFINLRQYLSYLADVKKNTFDTSNLLILDAHQLKHAIQYPR